MALRSQAGSSQLLTEPRLFYFDFLLMVANNEFIQRTRSKMMSWFRLEKLQLIAIN